MAAKKNGASAPVKAKSAAARPAPAKRIPMQDVMNPRTMANGKSRARKRG